jgi:endonuclease YncB( thermonuclease family)
MIRRIQRFSRARLRQQAVKAANEPVGVGENLGHLHEPDLIEVELKYQRAGCRASIKEYNRLVLEFDRRFLRVSCACTRRASMNSSKQLQALAVAILFSLTPGAGSDPRARAADSAFGMVTAVKGPNLVTFDYGAGTYDVHIAGVDLPAVNGNAADKEFNDRRAREFLESKLLNKRAQLRFHGVAPDGVILGQIYTIDKERKEIHDIGFEMVQNGVADLKLGAGDVNYAQLSQAREEAKSNKFGIWKKELEK